jgi:uncharacterized protein YidB (DUF937 family)
MFDFDQMAKNLKQTLGGPEAEQSRLVNGIVDVLFSRGPGLAGLIDKFKNKGFGSQASSWISRGENIPVSPHQVEQVLGPELLQQIATKTGLPMETVKQKLSAVLPPVVDQLTPEGAIPEEDILQQGLNFLRNRFSTAPAAERQTGAN